MNIFLFGASGPLGQKVLKLLLDQGHNIKALVRKPEKFKTAPSPLLNVVKGDVFLPDTFEQEMAGIDLVISCLGIGKSTKATTVYSEGGENITAAMRKYEVKKLMVVTSAMVNHSDPGTQTLFLRAIIRPLFHRIYTDMTRLEHQLQDVKDLDWICIRPTGFLMKGFTGRYRVSLGNMPEGGGKVSREDVADFMVKQLNSDEYVHQKPVVAY
jgi:putative NADH-flavin reductase